MLPYYISFILSCFWCFLGEKYLRKYDFTMINGCNVLHNQESIVERKQGYTKGKEGTLLRLHHICFIMAVLIMAILAGVRDYSVGTDIGVYGNSLFYYAQQVTFFEAIDSLPNIEPLYIVLVFFSTLFSDEPHVLYFFTGLITYSFILAGIVKFKNYAPITLTWFLFLCLLFGDSLNAMRQSIAISIGFFGFYYIIERQFVKYFASVLIAFMFHRSAIILIPVFFLYKILDYKNNFFIKILMFSGVIFGLIFFNNILFILINSGVLHPKMAMYYLGNSTGLSILAILVRLPFLLLIVLMWKKFYFNKRNIFMSPVKQKLLGDFFIYLVLLEMITVELSAYMPSLYRISLWFLIFRCIAYARICWIQKYKNRIIFTVILLMYSLTVFIYQNQIKGNNEIYPYVFGIF